MTVFLHLKHLFIKVHDKIIRQHKSFQTNTSPTLTDCPVTHSGYFPEKIIHFKTFSGLWDKNNKIPPSAAFFKASFSHSANVLSALSGCH